MCSNDISKITPPATLAELAALDATREVPYLKARCNRMGIHIPNPNPPPREIIPLLESRLIEHNKRRGMFLSDRSGDYFEWKAIKEDLEEFISYLRSLISTNPNPNPVNLVNPVQNPNPSPNEPHATGSSANHARTNPGSKADQTRTDPGSKADQSRPDPEPKANQSRNDPESPNEKSAKTPQKHDGATKKTAKTPDQPPALTAADLKNLSFDQLAELAIEEGLLPNPKHCKREEYANAFMDLVGVPPVRILLEDINSHFQSHILGLLEKKSLKAVCDQLLLPPPFGLYLLTSKSSLRRFRLRHHARETHENRIALRQEIERALTQPDLSDADFMRATEQLLKLRLVESSLHPDPDLAQTKTLIDLLEKIRAGKLAERKLALAESKK